MEDIERAQLLESLIGVSASRRTYYSEYRENERRLDHAIASLATISAALCKTTSGVPSLAQAVVQVAAEHFDVTWAAVVLTDQDVQRWVACRTPTSVEAPSAQHSTAALDQALREVLAQQRLVVSPITSDVCTVGAPMCLSDRVVGALIVALSHHFVMDERERSVLRTLANQAAVAIENARLFEESERLRSRAVALYEDTYRQKTELEEKNRQLAKARDRLAAVRKNEILNQERARIARDLHDTVAQHLISIGMTLEWCRVQVGPSSQTYARICNAKEIARSAISRMRDTIYRLTPLDGNQSSMVDVLRELALDFEKTSNLQVQIHATGDLQLLGVEPSHRLYYITQEALFNAYKHASASNVRITLHVTRANVRLIIADDGIGIDPQALTLASLSGDASQSHFGLRNMHERAHELGGSVQIVRPSGGGTEVCVTIPLRGISTKS